MSAATNRHRWTTKTAAIASRARWWHDGRPKPVEERTMSPRDLVLTTVYFTRRQRAALKRRAKATGVSRSELIRRAVDLLLGEPARRGPVKGDRR